MIVIHALLGRPEIEVFGYPDLSACMDSQQVRLMQQYPEMYMGWACGEGDAEQIKLAVMEIIGIDHGALRRKLKTEDID